MTLSTEKQAFMSQVNGDIRGTVSDVVSSALREPDNLDRWILALLEIKRNTESQLSTFKGEIKKLQSQNLSEEQITVELEKKYRWRADVIRVKNGAENRLDEAKFLKKNEISRLKKAIIKHKESMLYAGDDEDTCQFDDELWSVLDG